MTQGTWAPTGEVGHGFKKIWDHRLHLTLKARKFQWMPMFRFSYLKQLDRFYQIVKIKYL